MAEFTPQELEEQRRRANALRGQQMLGALASTSQIPGAAQQAQQSQRMGMAGLQQAERANMAELDRRDTQEQRALKRAMEADALAYQKEQDAIANARAEAEANRRRTKAVSDTATLVDEDTGDVIYQGPGATGAPGSGKGDRKLTAAEQKALYNAENMDEAIGQAEKLLQEGYSPGGFQGFWDQLTTGSQFSNWAASEEGQKFNSAMGTIREAALRTSTGAAAPESEQKDYMMTLIPRAGDTEEVISWKMDKIRDVQQNIQKMSGMDDPDAAFVAAVEAAREPIPGEEGETANPGDARRKRLDELRAKRAAGG